MGNTKSQTKKYKILPHADVEENIEPVYYEKLAIDFEKNCDNKLISMYNEIEDLNLKIENLRKERILKVFEFRGVCNQRAIGGRNHFKRCCQKYLQTHRYTIIKPETNDEYSLIGKYEHKLYICSCGRAAMMIKYPSCKEMTESTEEY